MHGNKIVLDLEFTPMGDSKLQKIAGNEILEIGAIKLNERNEILDEFQSYVRPQYSGIPPYITRITGIRAETVKEAPEYLEAMEAFTTWVGTERNNRFYTWSDTDQHVLLAEAVLKEAVLHQMYYAHWVDLQRIHQRIYGFHHPMNLTNALGSMQIYFVGTEHGALADARNTAEILQNLSSMEQVRERIQKSHITYNSADCHGFPMQVKFKKK